MKKLIEYKCSECEYFFYVAKSDATPRSCPVCGLENPEFTGEEVYID